MRKKTRMRSAGRRYWSTAISVVVIVLTALVIYFVNEKLKAVIDYLHSIETNLTAA